MEMSDTSIPELGGPRPLALQFYICACGFPLIPLLTRALFRSDSWRHFSVKHGVSRLFVLARQKAVAVQQTAFAGCRYPPRTRHQPQVSSGVQQGPPPSSVERVALGIVLNIGTFIKRDRTALSVDEPARYPRPHESLECPG
jgi:hypothetical protein